MRQHTRARPNRPACLAAALVSLAAPLAHAQLTSSRLDPLLVPDAGLLAPETTVEYLDSGAIVTVGTGLNQTFVDRILPLPEGRLGVLALGGDVAASLDFSAIGPVALSGDSNAVYRNFSGTWTPAGTVYHVTGAGGTSIFNSRFLNISGTNKLTDNGMTARSLLVDQRGGLQLSASQSYTGGTRIENSGQVVVRNADALGTGPVVVLAPQDGTGAAVSALRIELPSNQTFDNDVTLSSSTEPGAGFLSHQSGTLASTVIMFNSAPSPTNDPNERPQLYLSDRFTGTILTNGPGEVRVFTGGDFAGSIDSTPSTSLQFYLEGGGKISAPLTIDADVTFRVSATTLLPDGNFMGSGALADLTFEDDARLIFDLSIYDLGGVPTLFAGGSLIQLNGVDFDVAASGADWSTLTGSNVIEYLLIDGLAGTGTLTPASTIQGLPEAVNGVEGYATTFELREGSSQLWMIVSVATPIPEPSAFAALAGLAALGLSTTRRRRRA